VYCDQEDLEWLEHEHVQQQCYADREKPHVSSGRRQDGSERQAAGYCHDALHQQQDEQYVGQYSQQRLNDSVMSQPEGDQLPPVVERRFHVDGHLDLGRDRSFPVAAAGT